MRAVHDSTKGCPESHPVLEEATLLRFENRVVRNGNYVVQARFEGDPGRQMYILLCRRISLEHPVSSDDMQLKWMAAVQEERNVCRLQQERASVARLTKRTPRELVSEKGNTSRSMAIQ
jgi:hypothetical protein